MNQIVGKKISYNAGRKKVSGSVIMEVAPGIAPGKAFRLLPLDVRKGLTPTFEESDKALMVWTVLLSDGKQVHWLKRDTEVQNKVEEEEITAE